MDILTQAYTGKNVQNLKKMKLKVDVFALQTGALLVSKVSEAICDTASKTYGAMDLYYAPPLRSCETGGRKVMMISEFISAKGVEPRFQLYDESGSRLKNVEEMEIVQPEKDKVMRSRNSIVFISPRQPLAEIIMQNGWQVKLVARRTSDGLVSKHKFIFEFVPHDFYSPCVFCDICLDHSPAGPASLKPARDLPRPGLRKRVMENEDEIDGADSQSQSSRVG